MSTFLTANNKVCILTQPQKDKIPSECLDHVMPSLRRKFSGTDIYFVDLATMLQVEGVDVERIQYHFPGIEIPDFAQLRRAEGLTTWDWLPQNPEGVDGPALLYLKQDDYQHYSLVMSEAVAAPFSENEMLSAADALLERIAEDDGYDYLADECCGSILPEYEILPSASRTNKSFSEQFRSSPCNCSRAPRQVKESGFSAVEPTPEIDADEDFWLMANQLQDEIADRVRRLRKMGFPEQILASLLQLTKPELSRMTITPDYHIYLTDYDKEIKMSVLPKVLYFLFINHPEGLLFKNLVDHTDELMHYYNLLSNRENPDQMRKSIEDLVDSTSNSVNEKCSRIRSAFVQHFSEDVVNPYYVTSSLNRLKSVTFDRHLITSYPKELGWNIA